VPVSEVAGAIEKGQSVMLVTGRKLSDLDRDGTAMRPLVEILRTTDPALLTVSAVMDNLDPYVTFLSTRAVIETMVIKSKFYTSLVTHGIPHPTVQDPQQININEYLPHLRFPIYIRPARSLLFSQQFGVKGFVAHNRRELQQYLRVAEQADLRVMVQEIIPGPATNGFALRGYIDSQGRAAAVMATQKIDVVSGVKDESLF